MYTLRRITKDNCEINTCLGTDYVFVRKELSPMEFKNMLESLDFGDDKEWIESIYGFVSCDEGASLMPLYKGSEYYVMTSDGRTFSNITNK